MNTVRKALQNKSKETSPLTIMKANASPSSNLNSRKYKDLKSRKIHLSDHNKENKLEGDSSVNFCCGVVQLPESCVTTSAASAESSKQRLSNKQQSDRKLSQPSSQMNPHNFSLVDSKGNASKQFLYKLITDNLKEQAVEACGGNSTQGNVLADKTVQESATSMMRRRMLGLDSSFMEPAQPYVPYSELAKQETTTSAFDTRMNYLRVRRPAQPAKEPSEEQRQQKEALRHYQAQKVKDIKLKVQQAQNKRLIQESVRNLESTNKTTHLRRNVHQQKKSQTDGRGAPSHNSIPGSLSSCQHHCNHSQKIVSTSVISQDRDTQKHAPLQRKKNVTFSSKKGNERKCEQSKSQTSVGTEGAGGGSSSPGTDVSPPSEVSSTIASPAPHGTAHAFMPSTASSAQARHAGEFGRTSTQATDDQSRMLHSLLEVVDAYPATDEGAAALALLCAQAALLDNSVFAELLSGRILVLTQAGKMALQAAKQQEEPILPQPLQRVYHECTADNDDQHPEHCQQATSKDHQQNKKKKRDRNEEENSSKDSDAYITASKRKLSRTPAYFESPNTSGNETSSSSLPVNSPLSPKAECAPNISSSLASGSNEGNMSIDSTSCGGNGSRPKNKSEGVGGGSKRGTSTASSCCGQQRRLLASDGEGTRREEAFRPRNVARICDENRGISAVKEAVHDPEPIDTGQNNHLTPEEFVALNGADGNGPIMMQVSSPRPRM